MHKADPLQPQPPRAEHDFIEGDMNTAKAQWLFIVLFIVSAVAGIFAPFARLAEIELAGISCLLLAIFCRLPGRGGDE
jgi:hypothetical protein